MILPCKSLFRQDRRVGSNLVEYISLDQSRNVVYLTFARVKADANVKIDLSSRSRAYARCEAVHICTEGTRGGLGGGGLWGMG